MVILNAFIDIHNSDNKDQIQYSVTSRLKFTLKRLQSAISDRSHPLVRFWDSFLSKSLFIYLQIIRCILE